jgi:uncharacterized protein YjbI with pentapeptide repeats
MTLRWKMNVSVDKLTSWRDYAGVNGHRPREHNRWLNSNRQGPGPMELVENVSFERARISGERFAYSTLRHCFFSDAGIEYSDFDNSRFDDCWSITANLSHNSFHDAVIADCRLPRIDFRWGHFIGARLTSSVFDGSSFASAAFVGAALERCSFRGAAFAAAQFDRSTIASCDFREATLIGAPESGRCSETHFEDCDFRGADVTDRRLRDVTFTRCKFFGIQGRAILEGAVHVIDPDFSEAGDGSDVRDANALLAMWADPSTK